MKKIIFFIFSLITLSGCVQSTTMLAPALAGFTSGNAYQAGLSYGTNLTIKEKTGKTASEHIVDYKTKKTMEINLKNLIKEHIKLTKKKISLNTNN